MQTTKCPDPEQNPDDCPQCQGWGHRCSAFREAHPDRVAGVTAGYLSGFDPTRFYPTVFAAANSEAVTARQRKGN